MNYNETRWSCKSALIVGWRSIKLLPASSIHSARLALTGDCSGWLFRTFFAPTATFSPTKIRWHDRHQEWIKGSRTVAWRVVTSQWSFQETQIKLEYWRYLHCGTVAWHIVTSQWIFEETQLSAVQQNAPRRLLTQEWSLCGDQRVYYTTTTVSGATLSLISCPQAKKQTALYKCASYTINGNQYI